MTEPRSLVNATSATAADIRHIEAFLEMMAVEKGAARNTVASYGADLAAFATFARARGEQPYAAGAEVVAAYMQSLCPTVSARTQAHRRLAHLSGGPGARLRENPAP